MKQYVVILLCLLAKNIVQFADGYAICGNSTYKADETDAAVNEIVRRFMALRSPDWGWSSMSTVTTIQVSAPKKLFGREKTTELFKEMIKYNFDYLDEFDLAEYAFVARSLCLDPRKLEGHDLLERVHDGMSEFLANGSGLNPDDVLAYAMVLSCLCINDYPLDATLVDKLLEIQNKDGSFGNTENAVDDTISILRPVFCLTQMTIPSFNTTKVKIAVQRMREFILKQLVKTDNGVYIGQDEIMSSDALIGLWFSREPGEDPDKKWSCSEVMDTLGIHPRPADDEFDLQDRLLMITASDFLHLQSKSYECISETDPIPPGYKPKCDYEKPDTCDSSPK